MENVNTTRVINRSLSLLVVIVLKYVMIATETNFIAVQITNKTLELFGTGFTVKTPFVLLLYNNYSN